MTQLQLDLTELASLVGQRKAATVPELVRMNQRQAALRSDAAKHAPEPVNSDSAALSLENIRRAGRLFALDLPQPAHLVLVECLRDAADRSLAALHGQTRCALPGDLRPAQRDQFADPQPMPVAHQDRQRVTLTIPPALFCGRDQKLDFGRGQVFTLAAIFGVGSATYSRQPATTTVRKTADFAIDLCLSKPRKIWRARRRLFAIQTDYERFEPAAVGGDIIPT